jgi:arylsulfatase A-like enzyme
MLLAGPMANVGRATEGALPSSAPQVEQGASQAEPSAQEIEKNAPQAVPDNRPAARPNIVWIVVEDMSAHFGCYGASRVATPHVDRLAQEGIHFKQAFVTAPVCSAARSALVTGMYQTSIGAHHHRSGRGQDTVNMAYSATRQGPGKTDYNFQSDKSAYDGYDWAGRNEGQPFFAQIQLRGGKLRHSPKNDAQIAAVVEDPIQVDQVELPPYYPSDPVIRDDWARYLNCVRYTDWEVGQILARLKREGQLDNTYVFFITDHGISHARGKQFLYDEGIHVPLVVRGPNLTPGQVRDDLVVHIDLAATSLALAGIEVPVWMQSRDLLDDDYQPREWIVSARDRCDETVDHIRCVRTQDYKYIRNFYPQRPYLQPNAYKDNKQILIRLRELYASGKLDAAQSLVMADHRPSEELYDLRLDPHELHNLAEDPDHAEMLKQQRARLEDWIRETHDHGQQPEPISMYDSDMQVYLNGPRRRDPKRAAEIDRNIQQMKRWAAAGK